MSDSGSVRVAVRIRPFNDREKQMNAKLCLRMEGPTTYITDPETGQEKPFTFDFSYWSHDGFHTDENGEMQGDSDKYATQRKVFDDLGRDVLRSAFDGYNSCLFAYGQTGSGKSYSMVGYGKNRGIIPIVCEEMFKSIAENTDPTIKYEVLVSMLEIYNECVKDLLNPKNNPPGGLKIRSQKDIGVYVEDLLEVPVSSYEEIDAKMAEGTLNRSVASTKMNATSSRAHTVFSIVFCKKRSEMGLTSEVRSRINLVDLAGSERADSTGATGDRLKEGCAINASLSALGNVISALADLANGKKNVFIPYRNSALTRLLQDALGGNSRTIMICALSPADVNYDETVSTLRYASRAKQIKNKVSKNENPTDKLIQSLKEENARLMALLEGKMPVPSAEGADVAAMRQQLEQIRKEKEENDKMLSNLQMTWEEKLKQAQQQQTVADQNTGVMQAARDLGKVKYPYLINMHQDPVLNECVMYVLHKEVVTIGRNSEGGNTVAPDILVSGLHIKERHAELIQEGASFRLRACEPQTKLFVNGEIVGTDGVLLQPFDRVLVGNNFFFRFHEPGMLTDDAHSKWVGAEGWSMAIDEYQTKQGLRLQQAGSDVDAMEKEDSAKTRELERKLKEMEATVAKQREQQERMLLQQQEVMQNSGLSEEEKRLKLAQLQQQHQQALSSLEARAEQDRAVTVRVMQEQVRKRRQLKQMKTVMGGVAPLVQEANALCEEMGKPLKFEAKLVLKPDDQAATAGTAPGGVAQSMKSIIAVVVVTNTANNTHWIWDIAKFESRLFLMRDVYQDISEHGPVAMQQTQDPFWDPPEPVHVGRARIVLKALSQCVEVDGDAVVTNDTGAVQGSLNYEITPVDQVGEALEYTSSANATLGVHMRVRIKFDYIKDIPRHCCNNVYVQCDFLGKPIHSVPIPGKNSLCRLNFTTVLDFGVVDQALLDQLRTSAVIVNVYGYADAHISELTQNNTWLTLQKNGLIDVNPARAPNIVLGLSSQLQQGMAVRNPSGAGSPNDADGYHTTSTTFTLALPSLSVSPSPSVNSNSMGSPAFMTPMVTPTNSNLRPTSAPRSFEHSSMHNLATPPRLGTGGTLSMVGKTPLGTVPENASLSLETASMPGGAGTGSCQQCKNAAAVWVCEECDGKQYCGHCYTLMHRAPSRKNHVPKPISGTVPSTPFASPGFLATPSAYAPSPAYAASPSVASSGMFTPSAYETPSPSTNNVDNGMCERCATYPVAFWCGACAKRYCVNCDSLFHKAPSRRDHMRTPLSSSASTASSGAFSSNPVTPSVQLSTSVSTSSSSRNCEKCAGERASVSCAECGKVYCGHCDAMMHKAASRAGHSRTPL